MNDDDDILTIIYMMARSDGLSKAEAQNAVIRHADTGCGYTFKRKEPQLQTFPREEEQNDE